jgi:hypothetical protein
MLWQLNKVIIMTATGTEKKQSMDGIQLEMATRLPWMWHPAFKIGDFDGYDGRSFGARAGTDENLNVYNVLHEVAHAIEMTLLSKSAWKRRILIPSFDMRIKTSQVVMGTRYFEPATLQATERECRVGGIQKHLMEMGGYNTRRFESKFIRTLQYLPDSFFGGENIMGSHHVSDYSKKQKLWIKTRSDILKNSYKNFNQEDISMRWKAIMKHLGKSSLTFRSEN